MDNERNYKTPKRVLTWVRMTEQDRIILERIAELKNISISRVLREMVQRFGPVMAFEQNVHDALPQP